jgi:hypothetical protein
MGGECSTYGRRELYTGFWWGKLRERDHLEDSGVDGRIILRWIFMKGDGIGMEWTGLIWLRIGTGGSSCEGGTEPSGSIPFSQSTQ